MQRRYLDPSKSIIPVSAIVSGPKGRHLIKLALDTGATYTLISPVAAIDIGYDPARASRTTKITTPSGTEYVPLLKIASVRCIGMIVRNLDVVCHSLPPESTVDGLLGLNFLRKFNLSLFFRDHYLEIK